MKPRWPIRCRNCRAELNVSRRSWLRKWAVAWGISLPVSLVTVFAFHDAMTFAPKQTRVYCVHCETWQGV